MKAVSPEVVEMSGRHPERTIFTRFIPPEEVDDMPGMWRLYYEKRAAMTRSRLPPKMLDLVSALSLRHLPEFRDRYVRGEALRSHQCDGLGRGSVRGAGPRR
jgi:hypothetical protein